MRFTVDGSSTTIGGSGRHHRVWRR
uniref:Uncharacterized protein n=1 Tax=Oryza punctata TaxID=4537 RepID=A0A0E0JVG0_ORYPU